MTLVNLIHILKKADEKRYAVGAFNITAMETALGIIAAAEETKSPVILQLSEKSIEYMGLQLATAIASTLAHTATVPVVVHFDHGRNFPLVRKAVLGGFTSAMLDVSKVNKDERIIFVKDFVTFAHKRKVSVEAEEDVIGGREDYESGNSARFTDPKRAQQFTEITGVDCFAISIGNTHGKPLPHETFDLELISQINEVVKVPLVLHGASSTPDNLIREAISRGVCKINIDTDLRVAFSNELRHELTIDEDVYDPRDILEPTIEAVKEVVIKKIRLFGSDNMA